MRKIEKLVQVAESHHSKFIDALDRLKSDLQTKANFEIYIEHQASDGVVVGHDGEVTGIASFIDVINNKGIITLEDFAEITI